MARAILERERVKWCILSGFYGFVWPTTPIEFYEQRMEPVTKDTVWDECFGSINNRQFARLKTSSRVIVLGSSLYSQAAAILLDKPVLAPLAGLQIGQMLSAIKSAEWLKV